MALIICSECGKQFSDKATACPQCGCPTELARPKSNQATASQSKSTPNPEPIQELPEWSEELRPPTTTKKKPTPPKPAATPAPIPEWSEGPTRVYASEVQAESAADRLKKAAEVDVETESAGYLNRRAESKPLLIAAAVGLVAPVTSVVWGVRQRSWVLGATPFGLALALSFLFNSEGEVDKTRKYAIQFAAGALAYVIALDIKQRAGKSPSGQEATTTNSQTNQPSRPDTTKPASPLPSKTQNTDQAAASKKILSVIAMAGGSVIGISLMTAVRQSVNQSNQANAPAKKVEQATDIRAEDKITRDSCASITHKMISSMDASEGISLYDKNKSNCTSNSFNKAAAWHFNEKAINIPDSNPKLALTYLTKSIALYPKDPVVLTNAADRYFDSKQYSKAVEMATRAISIDPRSKNAYYGRGVAYSWLDNYKQSCQDLKKALELGRDDAQEAIANVCS